MTSPDQTKIQKVAPVGSDSDAGTPVAPTENPTTSAGLSPSQPVDSESAGLGPSPPVDSESAGLSPSPPVDSESAGLGPSPPVDSESAGLSPSQPVDSESAGLSPSQPVDSESAGLGLSQPVDSDVGSSGSESGTGDSGKDESAQQEDESARQESDTRAAEIVEAVVISGLGEDLTPQPRPELDSKLRAYATGRRKRSVARVWIKSSDSGKFSVNGRKMGDYFARPVLQMIVRQPFEVIGQNDGYAVYCTVKGGGLSGQAGALRHGLSRALDKYNPILHPLLKHAGLLTRDSRMVERKKYGRPKARRSFQFSKR